MMICNYSADGTVKVLNGYDNLIFANREPRRAFQVLCKQKKLI